VTLTAIGEGINKMVDIAELIKYRVKGLHQINNIGIHEIYDIYEPLEEGLDRLTFLRNVT
jgi:DNA-binding protein